MNILGFLLITNNANSYDMLNKLPELRLFQAYMSCHYILFQEESIYNDNYHQQTIMPTTNKRVLINGCSCLVSRELLEYTRFLKVNQNQIWDSNCPCCYDFGNFNYQPR